MEMQGQVSLFMIIMAKFYLPVYENLMHAVPEAGLRAAWEARTSAISKLNCLRIWLEGDSLALFKWINSMQNSIIGDPQHPLLMDILQFKQSLSFFFHATRLERGKPAHGQTCCAGLQWTRFLSYWNSSSHWTLNIADKYGTLFWKI